MSRMGWSDVQVERKCRVGSSGKFLSIPFETKAPKSGGVYVFIAYVSGTTQQVIYVGETDNLHRRMGEYARGTFPSAKKQEKRVAEIMLSYVHGNDQVDLHIASAGQYRGQFSDSYDPDSEADRLALEGMVVRDYVSRGYDVINDAVRHG